MVLPLEPGLATHVRLFDLECFPPHALAAGEGGDEADALLALWTTLTDQHESADAIAVVAEAYSGSTQADARNRCCSTASSANRTAPPR